MGTRADFYVGTGPNAEWLGSVAFDGYEWAEEPGNPLAGATSEAEYREQVKALMGRRDATKPERGWPWPWDDSSTTDYAYYWDGSKVRWDGDDNLHVSWPDMSSRRNVRWDAGSGLVVLTLGRDK